MAIIRRPAALPEEFQLLLVLKEPVNDVVPYRPPGLRQVSYYFRRAEILGVAGQFRPSPRIELVAILKKPRSVAATSPTGTVIWEEVGRETHTVEHPVDVAERIRLTGFLATDVIESHIEEYPYFEYLQFFNDIVPRPGWLDEKVQ